MFWPWKLLLKCDLPQVLSSPSLRGCSVPVNLQLFLLFQSMKSLVVKGKPAQTRSPQICLLTGKDAAGYQHDWSRVMTYSGLNSYVL